MLTSTPGSASTSTAQAAPRARPTTERASQYAEASPIVDATATVTPGTQGYAPRTTTNGAAQRIWPTSVIAPHPTREMWPVLTNSISTRLYAQSSYRAIAKACDQTARAIGTATPRTTRPASMPASAKVRGSRRSRCVRAARLSSSLLNLSPFGTSGRPPTLEEIVAGRSLTRLTAGNLAPVTLAMAAFDAPDKAEARAPGRALPGPHNGARVESWPRTPRCPRA